MRRFRLYAKLARIERFISDYFWMIKTGYLTKRCSQSGVAFAAAFRIRASSRPLLTADLIVRQRRYGTTAVSHCDL